MSLFRPRLDIRSEQDKKASSTEHVEEASCDDVEPAGPAGQTDIPALEQELEKAERRLNRARSRLEQIEGELLLTEDQDDVEDLREEETDAKARMEKANVHYEKVKRRLDLAKAKVTEEAKVEAELSAASEAEEKARRDEVLKRAKEKAKARKGPVEPSEGASQPKEEKADEECVPVEVMEESELGPMPRPRKKFKWTPKKAIAVGAVLFLVLPVVLYTVVVPRVDVTVKSWYYEGFQNSIVVDTKVINDGSVEVRNLDINVSVLKVVNGLEVYITQLTGQTMSIGSYSEKKFSSIELHDDQNDRYVLLVRVSFDAGARSVHESYTHHIDGPYMNIYFEDHIAELAI
jgi:hypothetical protein